jgi:riboflavin synthase
MFTGIVEEVGRISSISEHCLSILSDKITKHITLGDSIDVNGICLTVTDFDRKSFSVDVMAETTERTTLKRLKPGDAVNLESALTLQKPLGGHLVQGHVDGTGEVSAISHEEETTSIDVNAPPDIMRYVVEKGFIAVDGISLTVASRNDEGFTVAIVNFTWNNTSLRQLAAGDGVNLEVDIIAKYVEQLTTNANRAVTMEFLKEQGFLGA